MRRQIVRGMHVFDILSGRVPHHTCLPKSAFASRPIQHDVVNFFKLKIIDNDVGDVLILIHVAEVTKVDFAFDFIRRQKNRTLGIEVGGDNHFTD
jgi:hypothetical protein